MIVTIEEQNLTLTEAAAIQAHLSPIGIEWEQWETVDLPDDAPASAVLDAYKEPIERLKQKGGYVTADVIDVYPTTPGLDAMLLKFQSEHWHDEDEVRFTVEGRGLFHIHPQDGPVTRIEVGRGDLIRVPRGALHWFHLCGEKRIRAIRLFQDPAGWTPHYTSSGVDSRYQTVCFGPAYGLSAGH